ARKALFRTLIVVVFIDPHGLRFSGVMGIDVPQWVGHGIPNVVWASVHNPRRIWVGLL
ncbi:hypothetical protein PanWU01x14_301790, partial [Parasponia andersonii]